MTAPFLAALGVRLLWLAVWQARGLEAVYGHDPYPETAELLLGWRTDGFDAAHPPVYPLWIALLYLARGAPSHALVRVVNALLSALTCVLVGRWAERTVSKKVGRAAAWWTAFDPLLVFFSIQLQSETFFLLLLALFLLALPAGVPSSPRAAFGLGLLGGLASLTRSVFAPYPPLLFAWLAAKTLRRRIWAIALAGWLAPIAFWTARNHLRYETFLPLAANGGWNLWEGFTLDREEVRRRPHAMTEELARAGVDSTGDPMAPSRYFLRKTIAFVRAEPLAAARIVTGKALLYWRPWPYDPHGRAARGAAAAYFTLLFLLAAVGAWSLRGRPELAPAWLLIAWFSVAHSVFFTSLRYRAPLEPLLCLLACAGALRLKEKG